MKKIPLIIILAMISMVVLAGPALAATTVSFSPASVKVTSGQNFDVAVAINPQGINNYTVKIQLDYPADIFEVKSFSFGNSWMPVIQSGYDLIDNTSGVLIKTGGYPGGVSSPITFGTVSFYAKKAGSGTVKIGNGSLVLNANNQNVLSGTSGIAFVVTAPAPIVPKQPAVPTPTSTPTPTLKPKSIPISTPTSTSTPAPAAVPTVPAPATRPAQQPVPQTSFIVAIIGNVLALGTDNVWVSILTGLIIFAVVVYAIYTLVRKKRKKFGKR